MPSPNFTNPLHTYMPHMTRCINFGAGPASLPLSVLEAFSSDMLDFNGQGMGVGEISHRGAAFEQDILLAAEKKIAQLTGYNIPEEWQVLWMTGGGTGQFAAVPMNYLGEGEEGKRAVYLISGTWSEKAAGEAERLMGRERVIRIDMRVKSDSVGLIDREQLKILLQEYTPSSCAYVYACDNETVDGIELPEPDWITSATPAGIPVILDCSSNFLSRPLPEPSSGISLIFAGVQKNLGAAGVTVVLKRRSFIASGARPVPSVLDYNLTAKNNSLLNTPPVMAIHLCSLMLDWLIKEFADLITVDGVSRQKASKLYDTIAGSNGLFYCQVQERFRSRMNVVFHGRDEAREDEFLELASKERMVQLKGHRSVGGLRASLYNAIDMSQVDKLCLLIKSLAQ